MILLTGANGVVGRPLGERLSAQNKAFKRVSRQAGEGLFKWDLTLALSDTQAESLKGTNTLIHCAPIWLLSQHIDKLYSLGIKRMVVFSSTSVISKQTSADESEQRLVSLLSKGESSLLNFASSSDLKVTILRPSMIYGYGRDQNVSHIAGFIKKYRFMVLMGKASGLRQPVHCDDLVKACLSVLDQPKCFSRSYNLAGAESLTYRSMVERIFKGLGRTPFIIRIPLSLFRAALNVAALLGKFSYTPEMANRMNHDLAYDYQDACDDFAYQPQKFLQNPQQDLPQE